MSKVLKVGITDYYGDDDADDSVHSVTDGTPEIWFRSLPALARTLAGQNLAVLNVIRESKPQSLLQLAEMTGRNIRTVAEILQNMEKHGLVTLHKGENRMVRPEVNYDSVQLVIDLDKLHFNRRQSRGRNF